MGDTPVLDRAVIENLRQLTPPGEPDVLTEVLRMFLHEVPVRIERLRNAWAAGNIKELHRVAHSLKGSAGNVGALRLYDVCRQLDELGRVGDAASPGLVEALAAEYQAVEAEMKQILGQS